MANTFFAEGSTGPGRLTLSNGATDVFFDVLTLAGCAIAETPWQRHLALFCADGHRLDRGCAGFDLGELPWTPDWPAEKSFFLRLIDMAATRHGWDLLRYEPPYASNYLAAYRRMVDGYRPVPAESSEAGDWREPPAPELLERCDTHHIYQGQFGCRLCDPELQPEPSTR
ncbi:hypothetical protein [Plantactinospora sonchi]|uniref:Uncharacterized protein n=1 Tax=Plantactinospora sonchi TaxID=1544735 RepID=A0ABU7RM44_9ACTN